MKTIDVDGIKEGVRRLVRKHGLGLLLVYGSVAKGQANEGSDIGVAFRAVGKLNG